VARLAARPESVLLVAVVGTLVRWLRGKRQWRRAVRHGDVAVAVAARV